LRLSSFGGYGLALAALALVVFGPQKIRIVAKKKRNPNYVVYGSPTPRSQSEYLNLTLFAIKEMTGRH